jgi:hypothetical protein
VRSGKLLISAEEIQPDRKKDVRINFWWQLQIIASLDVAIYIGGSYCFLRWTPPSALICAFFQFVVLLCGYLVNLANPILCLFNLLFMQWYFICSRNILSIIRNCKILELKRFFVYHPTCSPYHPRLPAVCSLDCNSVVSLEDLIGKYTLCLSSR